MAFAERRRSFLLQWVRPAAAECPPKRSSSGAQAHKAARAGLKLVVGRAPLAAAPRAVFSRNNNGGAASFYFSIRRVATMPITPGCQPSPDTTITRSRTRAGSALSFFQCSGSDLLFRLLTAGWLISERRAAMPAACSSFSLAQQQLQGNSGGYPCGPAAFRRGCQPIADGFPP